MLEFCPLCYKNEQKRKIILYQINPHEAVWLCESSECPWPFGSEDFTFVSRKIGDTWSAEWETNKPSSVSSKSSECFQIPLGELGLDTPPVTPGSGNDVAHKDTIFKDNTSLGTSLNLNTNNGIQTKADFVSSNKNSNKLRRSVANDSGSIDSGDKCYNQKSLINVKHNFRDNEKPAGSGGSFSFTNDRNSESLKLLSSQRPVDACDNSKALTASVFNITKPTADNLSLHESTMKCKKWLSDNSKDTVLENQHRTPLLFKEVAVEFNKNSPQVATRKLKRNNLENLNRTKRLPKIKSIERTNVKLEAVIPSDEKNNSTRFINLAEKVEVKKEKMETSIVRENSSEACRVENKTFIIDGTFPISLSYEIPSPATEDCTNNTRADPAVDSSVLLVNVKNEPVDCSEIKIFQSLINPKTETRRQSMQKPLKRSVPKVTKYQGFNFGALKKKPKPHGDESNKFSLSSLPSPDNASTCSDITWTSDTSCMTTTTVDSKLEFVVSNGDSNSKSTLTSEISSPAISCSDSKSSNSCNSEKNQVLESNLNLDLVLNDLLLNEGDSLPQDFGDDWIVSLFD